MVHVSWSEIFLLNKAMYEKKTILKVFLCVGWDGWGVLGYKICIIYTQTPHMYVHKGIFCNKMPNITKE